VATVPRKATAAPTVITSPPLVWEPAAEHYFDIFRGIPTKTAKTPTVPIDHLVALVHLDSIRCPAMMSSMDRLSRDSKFILAVWLLVAVPNFVPLTLVRSRRLLLREKVGLFSPQA
jgi:hypothetical protein